MEVRQGHRKEDAEMTRSEERIESLKLALAACRGARDEMDQLLADIADAVHRGVGTDWDRLDYVKRATEAWVDEDE